VGINPFEFVIIIIILSMIGQAIRSHYRTKELRRDRESNEAEVRETLDRLSKLEERIRVLERIVTDERYELKQRFKDL
jgi:FixJ family two-component response regulator